MRHLGWHPQRQADLRRHRDHVARGGSDAAYYGAEDFALHAIARTASSGAQLDLLALVNAIRFGAAAAVTFAAGLALLGIAGVLLAISTWRTAILPRFSAVPLAVALVLLIPQFYLPAWARIAHGILVAVALLWLAWALWTKAVAGASETLRLRRTPRTIGAGRNRGSEMRIFVLAERVLGWQLLPMLAAHGHQVVGMARHTSAEVGSNPNVELVTADALDASAVASAYAVPRQTQSSTC